MKTTLALYLAVTCACVVAETSADTIPKDGIVAWYHQHYPFISMTDSIYTVESEFRFPESFTRPDSSELNHYQNWVAHLPLWHRYKSVGIWKGGKAYEFGEVSRVVHIPWRGPVFTDVGFPLLFLAEYLRYRNREPELTIVPRAGDTLDYITWLESKLVRDGRGHVKFIPGEKRDTSVYEYYQFLSAAMRNSTYASLAANCDSLSVAELAPGDMLIGHDEKGRHGCAYVILNVVQNKADERCFIVGTGCVEACDFHIPLFGSDRDYPWIAAEELEQLAASYPQKGFFRFKIR